MTSPSLHSKRPSCLARPNAGAFTLIELLTVIAIIGILAAITIPTVGRVRESAKQATAISRARHLGMAFQMFANDNRDRLPYIDNKLSNRRWPLYLVPYLDLPYQVQFAADGYTVQKTTPSSPTLIYNNPVFRDPANPVDQGGAGTFAYNLHLENQVVQLPALKTPSGLPILASSDGNEGGGLRLSSAGPAKSATRHGVPSGSTDKYGPSPNYGRKAVFLFADWHVAAIDVCNLNAWPWTTDDGVSPFKLQ